MMIELQAQAGLLFVEPDPGFTFSGGPTCVQGVTRAGLFAGVQTIVAAMQIHSTNLVRMGRKRSDTGLVVSFF
jgi:hypothetical protein